MPATEYFPVREITPYNPHWTIKARVVHKTDIREFKTRGSSGNQWNTGGKVFSVDLVDKEGGEIKASFFNDAAQKFGSQLTAGKCYTFKKGKAVVANRSYTQCKNDYELRFEAGWEITEASDDSNINTELSVQFIDIKTLKNKALPFTCDIIGIMTKVSPKAEITTKNGDKMQRSTLEIADESKNKISISLFGQLAEDAHWAVIDDNFGKVVGIKSVRFTEFNPGQKSGVVSDGGWVKVNPHDPRATALEQWWSGVDNAVTFTNLSSSVGGSSLEKSTQVTMMQLIHSVEPSLNDTKGVLSEFTARLVRVIDRRRDEVLLPYYTACALERSTNDGSRMMKCNKKIDGSGHCASCGLVPEEKRIKRWMVRCVFQDFTGANMILQLFDDQFNPLCGKTAEEAAGQGDLENFLKGSAYQGLFKLRVRSKLDEYDGKFRPRHTVTSVQKVSGADMMRHAQNMIDEISALA